MICPRCSQRTKIDNHKHWYCDRCQVDYVSGFWGNTYSSDDNSYFVWDYKETFIYDERGLIHKAEGLLSKKQVDKFLKNKAFL